MQNHLMKQIIAAICLMLLSSISLANDAQVKSVRLWASPDSTRLVFDMSTPAAYKVITLDNPDRLVVDLESARLAAPLGTVDYNNTLLQSIRSAPRNGKDLRVVLDLKNRVRPEIFMLNPAGDYGYRLVIDLYDANTEIKSISAATSAPLSPAPSITTNDKAPDAKALDDKRYRDIVIAIDAGHGG